MECTCRYVRSEAAAALALTAIRGGVEDTDDSSDIFKATKKPHLALICGMAVNQDGRSSALTAPNGPAQQMAIRAALEDAAGAAAGFAGRSGGGMYGDGAGSLSSAGSSALRVSRLQMHGTGTPLGDPIEAGAATAALRPLPATASARGGAAAERRATAALPAGGGTVPLVFASDKSAIGHSEPTAGVMGILHALSAMRNQLVGVCVCDCCLACHAP